jgi:hypothetical protein
MARVFDQALPGHHHLAQRGTRREDLPAFSAEGARVLRSRMTRMRALKENEKDLGCSTTHKQQGLLDVIGVIGEITEMKRGHMK